MHQITVVNSGQRTHSLFLLQCLDPLFLLETPFWVLLIEQARTQVLSRSFHPAPIFPRVLAFRPPFQLRNHPTSTLRILILARKRGLFRLTVYRFNLIPCGRQKRGIDFRLFFCLLLPQSRVDRDVRDPHLSRYIPNSLRFTTCRCIWYYPLTWSGLLTCRYSISYP